MVFEKTSEWNKVGISGSAEGPCKVYGYKFKIKHVRAFVYFPYNMFQEA